MKLDWNKRYTTISVYAFLTAAAIALFWKFLNQFEQVTAFLQNVMQILMPFIYGAVLAYLLSPVVKGIERVLFGKWLKNKVSPKPRRALSMLLTYLLALVVLSVFALIVIPQVVVGISNIALKVPGYMKNMGTLVQGWVEHLPNLEVPQDVIDNLIAYTQTVLAKIYALVEQALPVIISATSKLTTSLLNIIVGIIISIYILADKERFLAQGKKVLHAFLPAKEVEIVLDLVHSGNKTFSGFINGKLLDSLIIGILCFIGMSLFRMPSVMLVSLIVGITNVIPYFGPFIGAIPGTLIILIDDPIKALWFVLFIVALQQFDGNILGPKILGDSTGLSAFWVVFAILLFGGLFGFIGMFVGVPLFAVIYACIRTFVEGKLAQKGLPVKTKEYASQNHPIEF